MSRYRWTTLQAASNVPLGAEESVFMDPHGPTIKPYISDRCDSGQNKTQKSFSAYLSIQPLCSQSSQPFQPLATRAEA